MRFLHQFISTMDTKVQEHINIFQSLKQYDIFFSEIEVKKRYKQFQNETYRKRLEISFFAFKNYILPSIKKSLNGVGITDKDFIKIEEAYNCPISTFLEQNKNFKSLHNNYDDSNSYSAKNIFQKFIEVQNFNIPQETIYEFSNQLESKDEHFVEKTDFSDVFEYKNKTSQRYFNTELSILHNEMLAFVINKDKDFIIPQILIDAAHEFVEIRNRIDNQKNHQDDAEIYKNSVKMFLLADYDIDEHFLNDFNLAYNKDVFDYKSIPDQARLRSGINPSSMLCLDTYLKFHFRSHRLLTNMFRNQKIKINTQFQIEDDTEFQEYLEKMKEKNPFFQFDNSLAVERAYVINEYFTKNKDLLRKAKKHIVLQQLKKYHKYVQSAYMPYASVFWEQIKSTVRLLHMFDVSREVYKHLRKTIAEDKTLQPKDIAKMTQDACDFIINISFSNAEHFPSNLKTDNTRDEPIFIDGKWKKYYYNENKEIVHKWEQIPAFIKENIIIKDWYDVTYDYEQTMTSVDFLSGYEYCFVDTFKHCETRLQSNAFEFWREPLVPIQLNEEKRKIAQESNRLFVKLVNSLYEKIPAIINHCKEVKNIPSDMIDIIDIYKWAVVPEKNNQYFKYIDNPEAKVAYIEQFVNRFLFKKDERYYAKYKCWFDETTQLAFFRDVTTGKIYKIYQDLNFALYSEFEYSTKPEKARLIKKYQTRKIDTFRALVKQGVGFRLGFFVTKAPLHSWVVTLVEFNEHINELCNLNDVDDIDGISNALENVIQHLDFDGKPLRSYLMKLKSLKGAYNQKKKAQSVLYSIKIILEKILSQVRDKKRELTSLFQYCKTRVNSFIRRTCIANKFSFFYHLLRSS